jgi:hypothetical protein
MPFGEPYPRPIWLIVFLQDGCGACTEAEPHLRALKAKYPLKIMIVERYLNRSDTKVPGIDWLPASTPAYALIDQDGPEKKLIRKRVGPMTLAQLEKFVSKEYLP